MGKKREIKFRVWRKNTKEWEDHYHIRRDGTVMWDIGGYENDAYELEDAVLMQYTGLKDKNGKEIYEGDIYKDLAGNITNTHTVEYSEENGGWSWSYAIDEWCDNPGEDYEVIGNIYENPELLK